MEHAKALPPPIPRSTLADERQVIRDMVSDYFEPAEPPQEKMEITRKKEDETGRFNRLKTGKENLVHDIAAARDPAHNLEALMQRQVLQLDKDTSAYVLPEVAKHIYKNALKGDPVFKPQKGNYGRISWFQGKIQDRRDAGVVRRK